MKNSVFFVAAFLASAFSMSASSAQAMSMKSQPKAVLELFTSQGCSSCPPADEILGELAKNPDLITLAYHVDYWNYIGWEDTFSSKEHSDLQRRYAQQRGAKQIYTPQLLVNGKVDVVGSRRTKLDKAIDEAHLIVPVMMEVSGDMLSIDIPSQAGFTKPAAIWLVPFISAANVDVQRGENAGNVYQYSSIVKDRQIVGMWTPSEGTSLKLPVPTMLGDDVDGLAVLVQTRSKAGLPGPILGAAAVSR